MKEYLRENTEDAAVMSYVFDAAYPSDTTGTVCLPSGAARTVTLTLRNPQHYTLSAGYSLPSAAASVASSLSSPITYAQSSDLTHITATLSDEFITALDCGGDISFTVSLTEVKSQRSFTTYTVPVHANTPPVSVTGAVVCVQGPSGSQTYVLCFNLPEKADVASGTIQNDLSTITVNDTSYTMSLAADGTASLGSGLLSSPSSLANFTAGPGGHAFAPGGQPVYVATRDTVSTDNKVYTITLADVGGLTTSAQTSVYAEQLGAVTGLDSTKSSADPNQVSQNDDGTGTVTLSVPSATVEGNTYDTTGATVVYRVYTGTSYSTLYASGTSSSTTVALSLPAGDSLVKATARKSLYVDSEEVLFYCKVARTRVYVSSGGSDTNGGYAAAPVQTIGQAVSMLDDATLSGNTIYVLSDLTMTAAADEFIKLDTAGLNVTITGADTSRNAAQRTISANSMGRVCTISADGGSITLKNLTITGGSSADSSGGLKIATNTASSALSVTMNNCTISGNTGRFGGGLAVIPFGAGAYTVALTNCTISGNTAISSVNAYGGGIYYNGGTSTGTTLALTGCTVSGNTVSTQDGTARAGGVYASGSPYGSVQLTDTTVTGNTAVATGTGTVQGSAIYANSCSVTVSGSTTIGTANDVYLAANTYLTADSLTGGGTVAKITPSSYTVGSQVLTGTALTQSVCNRFAVSENSGSAYVVLCSSTTSGVIGTAGATTVLDLGTYTFAAVDANGTALSSFTSATTVYWTIRNSAGTVIARSGTASSSVTSSTISLYSNGAPVLSSTKTDGTTGTISLSGLPVGSYRLYLKAVIGGQTYDGYVNIVVGI